MTTKEAIQYGHEDLLQRARLEVIDACQDHFSQLPKAVQDALRIYNWIDGEQYTSPPEER